MLKLSVIIVTYNSGKILEKCLSSLQNGSFKDLEIIVVDNASKDNPSEIVKKYSKINFIKNSENLGFSKANNIGVKRARGEYVLFLNPDMKLNPDTLQYIYDFMKKNKDVGASTCKVLLPNGRIDDSSHRGMPTPWNAMSYFLGFEKLFPKSRLFGGYHMGWESLEKAHEIQTCAGSFMFVRREAGEDVGWWDEDYFFYGEDLEFCWDLRQKGWKVYYVPEVSAYHYKGTSSGIKEISKKITTATLATKKIATMHRFRSMEIFYKKHYAHSYPFFINWTLLLAIKIKFLFARANLS